MIDDGQLIRSSENGKLVCCVMGKASKRRALLLTLRPQFIARDWVLHATNVASNVFHALLI